MRIRTTARSAGLKDAIIASFRADARSSTPDFARFNAADWASVMGWLDIGGMAIYFLHRARQIGVEESLPEAVKSGLEQRLENNRVRMQSLLQESHAFAELFQIAGIPYALLKGFTLAPDSVPESTLRSQADLDFMVSRGDTDIAIRCIHAMGYERSGVYGNTMEFHAGVAGRPDLAKIYSAHTRRALELHLLPESSSQSSLLTRRVERTFGGFSIHALSPADIMVQQAIHLLKHLCGEHTRLSWVLEFWRHAATRQSDKAFWSEAKRRAAEIMNGDLAMGIAFRVAGEFFGDAGVVLPEQWSCDALPVRVRVWTERYARPLMTSDQVGSKLYAILKNEIPCAPHEARKIQDILLPRVFPFRIVQPQPHEKMVDRLDRYQIEVEYFLRRLEFHVRASLHLIAEMPRWSRAIAKAERKPPASLNAAQDCPTTLPDRLGGFKDASRIVGGHGD